MKTYSIGSSGDGVREVQNLLKEKGYDLDADGIYGPITENAVRDYQTQNKLSVDGIAGDETIGHLRQTSNGSNTTNAGSVGNTTSNPNLHSIAQNKLSLLQNGRVGSLDDTINELYNKVLNQKEFDYDPYADPTYNRYAETYKKNAQLMSEDTMAQAAALTGGFGSSYGQAVASQAYNEQMSELNDIIPELRNDAYSEWKDERNREIENLSLLLNERDYERAIFESDREFDESVRRYDTDFAEAQRLNNANLALDRESLDLQKQKYNTDLNAQAMAAGFASWDDYVNAVKNGTYKPTPETKVTSFTDSQIKNAEDAFVNGNWSGLENYIRNINLEGKYTDEQIYNLMYRSTGIDQIDSYEDALKWFYLATAKTAGKAAVGVNSDDKAINERIDISSYSGSMSDAFKKRISQEMSGVLTENAWKAEGGEYGSYPEYLRRSMLYWVSDKR